MKKVIFFCICFLTFNTCCKAYQAAVVMDADSKRVLFSQDENSPYLIASTTKIMTALVVLNNVNIKEEVTASEEEIKKAYGSSIYLKPKEKMTVEDLLYGLMLRSGNDAALVLAKHTAGSVEGFVKLMNDTALMIGMHDTTFNNPHGLDEETENKSTVYDMALLMVEAMKNETFKQITSAKSYKTKSNFNTHDWINKNRLLTDYKYATGGKIGFTTRARHTFVSSATKDNKNLVVATFKDSDRFGTHKNLYEKYFDEYKKYNIIKKDKLKIDYKPGYKVYTTSDFSMLLKKDEKKKVIKEIELYNNVGESDHTQIIGTIKITMNGKTYSKQNIYAERKIPLTKSFIDKVKEFFKW